MGKGRAMAARIAVKIMMAIAARIAVKIMGTIAARSQTRS